MSVPDLNLNLITETSENHSRVAAEFAHIHGGSTPCQMVNKPSYTVGESKFILLKNSLLIDDANWIQRDGEM